MTPAKSLVILIVEDDPDLRQLYRTALSSHGYAVVAVEDGLDALRVIEGSLVPTAVVLDLELPRLSGRDVYAELRSHSETSGIPVIVVTGTDTSDLNPDDSTCILHKPVSISALIENVERCLRAVGS